MEFEFIDKFYGIIFAIMSYFPISIIIGNYNDVVYFWSYDIYLHDLGYFFDDKGRYFYLKNKKKEIFLKFKKLLIN